VSAAVFLNVMRSPETGLSRICPAYAMSAPSVRFVGAVMLRHGAARVVA
jgi:hypothetical protein